jgi:hypothetical protein
MKHGIQRIIMVNNQKGLIFNAILTFNFLSTPLQMSDSQSVSEMNKNITH